MKYTLALASTLLGAAVAAPQGVTDVLTPTAPAPAGCTGTLDGNFEITVAQVTEVKRTIAEKRAECGADGTLVMSLKDGSVYDGQDRTGYIASNFQFQFDGPPQAGALFTSGFSVCENNILALGDSTTFYRCLSGDFYNLYNEDWAEQCEPVSILALPCGGEDTSTEIPDGQIVATSIVQTTIVTALSDGQPQVITTSVGVPMCQIGDGQVQVKTTPCASVTPSPTTSYIPISESSDGQIIATTPGSLPPAPPATTTAVPSTSAATSAVPSAPATSAPAPTYPTTSYPVPANSTVSVPSSSFVSTSVSSETPTTSETAPPATSAPATGGATATTGSVGALVVGLLVAFVCL